MAKSNESKVKLAKKMINREGACWEDVSRVVELSVAYIQKLVKANYKTEEGYKKLLEKARANKKAKANAEVREIILEEVSTSDKGICEKTVKEVIVTETGYLMDEGVSGLLNQSLEIYVPFFCISELEKLSNSYDDAEKVLTAYWSTRKVTSINLRGKEELYEEPTVPVKDRSKGVVAVAVELDSLGYKVRLLTNSREIEELAKLQGCDIDVVRVKKAR